MKRFLTFIILIMCGLGIVKSQDVNSNTQFEYIAQNESDSAVSDKLAEFLAFIAIPENAETLANCTCKGKNLWGKVQVVNSFPDIKVKVVHSFPDIKVKIVDSFPDKCGKWKFVDSFPDFKIQFVDSFPDLKVQFVDSFP